MPTPEPAQGPARKEKPRSKLFTHMHAVLARKGLPARAKLAWVFLANQLRDDPARPDLQRVVWMGQDRQHERLGVSKATHGKSLADLERAGLLAIYPRPRGLKLPKRQQADWYLPLAPDENPAESVTLRDRRFDADADGNAIEHTRTRRHYSAKPKPKATTFTDKKRAEREQAAEMIRAAELATQKAEAATQRADRARQLLAEAEAVHKAKRSPAHPQVSEGNNGSAEKRGESTKRSPAQDALWSPAYTTKRSPAQDEVCGVVVSQWSLQKGSAPQPPRGEQAGRGSDQSSASTRRIDATRTGRAGSRSGSADRTAAGLTAEQWEAASRGLRESAEDDIPFFSDDERRLVEALRVRVLHETRGEARGWIEAQFPRDVRAWALAHMQEPDELPAESVVGADADLALVEGVAT